MHAGLMQRMGGRLEVARDNMGHAGNIRSITLDAYSKGLAGRERVVHHTRCCGCSHRTKTTLNMLLKGLVGERGFEPPTPWSRTSTTF